MSWTLCYVSHALILLQIDIPQLSSSMGIAYSAFFVAGSTGMLFINFKWFTGLVNRAKEMIRRVQNGESPTPDYDRSSQSSKSPETVGKKVK